MATPGANGPPFDCRAAAQRLCSARSAHSRAGGRTATVLQPGDPMTTFDDREQGFEKKFALDKEQEFAAAVRRNRALAKWAAGLMGLEGKHIDDYAKAVVKSDLELPGDEDVLRKVFEDLKGSGVS